MLEVAGSGAVIGSESGFTAELIRPQYCRDAQPTTQRDMQTSRGNLHMVQEET
jgi:hypothetical protein